MIGQPVVAWGPEPQILRGTVTGWREEIQPQASSFRGCCTLEDFSRTDWKVGLEVKRKEQPTG